MSSVACVCLSVCLFVRQHDNFQTIKCRMMKLGDQVHCTKILPEFEFGVKDQRSRSPGTRKTKKCGIFSGAVLVGTSSVVRQFYARGKISACCLMSDNE